MIKKKKIFAGIVVLISSYLVISIIVNNLYFSFFFKIDKQLALDGHKYLNQFKEDLEFLKKNHPFDSNTHSNDAGKILNDIVSFDISKNSEEVQQDGYLGVSKAIWVKSKSLDEFKKISKEELKDLDFRWLEGLSEFDHWNTFTHKAVQKHISLFAGTNQIQRVGLLAAIPRPDYVGLLRASLLYLKRELQGNDPLKALRNYRALAKFMFYSGGLDGSMAAISMLNTERQLISDFNFSDPQWKTYDRNSVDTLKRVTWAWTAYLNPILIDKFYSQLNRYLGVNNPTYCSANFESMLAYNFQIFDTKYFLERGLFFRQNPVFEYTSNLCGQVNIYRKIVNEPAPHIHFLIPHWRAIISGILTEAGTTSNSFRLYKEMEDAQHIGEN